jgi:Ca2+-transporting ATPase
MAAPTAKVIRGGHHLEVPGRELVPGDIVLLEAGDYIPADIRLSESVNLKIEEAAITGESVPSEKNAKTVFTGDVPLGDRENTAYMGTVVTYGRGQGIVVATGMNTEIGLIAKMLDSYEEADTPLQQKLAALGKFLGIAVLVICGIVFLTGLMRGEHPLEMFLTAVSLAVAAIPEGLPAIVTIVLALGMQKMVANHAIVKKLHAVETLGSTTIICSDKTGTLTQNKMMVVRLYTNNNLIEVDGRGYQPSGNFTVTGKKIEPNQHPNLSFLLRAGVLCNDSKLDRAGEISETEEQWRIIGDPTEGALIVAGAKAGFSKEETNSRFPREQEIPFDSERKMMTTFNLKDGNNGYYAFTKGAPDIMLSLSTKILVQGTVRNLTEEDYKAIQEANSNMANEALRVLAFAYREYEQLPTNLSPQEVEKDLIFIGLMGMIDPARPEAAEAIKLCKQAGIRPIMITGDYKDTAVAIAEDLGLIRDKNWVLEGAELSRLSDEQLLEKVEQIDVYARVSPEHKMRIIEALKNRNHIVAMTGDGVNDAPALKRADIGVAMGITGTDVAKETAEMILTDDNFASIVAAVKEGRVIFSNIRKFVFFLLSCNIGEVLIIFVSILLNLPIPLIPIQLLWINLLTDAFPALALGMEKEEPDIMNLPPRDPAAPILDRRMGLGIAIQSSILTIATLGAYVYGLKIYGNTGEGLKSARTIAFLTLTIAELLRAYSNRSERFSIFKIGFFSNKFMNLGVGLSFLLIIATVVVPPLRTIFETVPLDLTEIEIIIGFALLPFIVTEISKPFLKNTAKKAKA